VHKWNYVKSCKYWILKLLRHFWKISEKPLLELTCASHDLCETICIPDNHTSLWISIHMKSLNVHSFQISRITWKVLFFSNVHCESQWAICLTYNEVEKSKYAFLSNVEDYLKKYSFSQTRIVSHHGLSVGILWSWQV
jgi:hypothetical protein